jgi:hypothetical protein
MAEQQALADVELDHVGSGVDGGCERLQRVLGRDGGRAAVADHERAAVGPA